MRVTLDSLPSLDQDSTLEEAVEFVDSLCVLLGVRAVAYSELPTPFDLDHAFVTGASEEKFREFLRETAKAHGLCRVWAEQAIQKEFEELPDDASCLIYYPMSELTSMLASDKRLSTADKLHLSLSLVFGLAILASGSDDE